MVWPQKAGDSEHGYILHVHKIRFDNILDSDILMKNDPDTTSDYLPEPKYTHIWFCC